MDKKDSKAHIQKAWELAEDPEKIKDYYHAWANSYDSDVTGERYQAPHRMVQLLHACLQKEFPTTEPPSFKFLDAGCGTGLVGEQLYRRGYRDLTGFDLSTEMLSLANAKQCYTRLIDAVDLTLPLAPQISEDKFDVVICVGVLTLGHVPPRGVERMLEVLSTKGVLALNAREAYVKEQNFEQYCANLVASKKVQIIHKEYSFLIDGADCLYLIMQKN